MTTSREAALQQTIDRIALELTRERTAHASTREALAAAQRRARTWRRVAVWIWAAQRPEE